MDTDRLAARRTSEFESLRADDGEFRPWLKAANGQVIAESQA